MNSSEYSYHTNASDIDPIEDHVLIDFIESTGERVVNGIILPGEESTERGIRPRWARIYKVGPKQKDVQAGQWAFVKHGEWTRGVLVGDKVYRRINPKEIFLVSDEQPSDVKL